jgi:hippurate hydrolase
MRNPNAGAEDFSRVLAAVPGCYLMLGAHPGDEVQAPNNHSPRAVFVDEVMPDGVLLHAQLAIRALQRDAKSVYPTAPGPTEP